MNADGWIVLGVWACMVAGLVIPLVAYLREERKWNNPKRGE